MKTVIIAEIGVNHNGSVKIAKKLIKKTAEAGTQFVKFQLFNPDKLVTPDAGLAGYQFKNLKKKKISQKKMLQKYTLNENKIIQLKKYAKKCKTSFLLSVFDVESLKIIKKLNLNLLKIPSGEITNYPLLKSISKMKVKIILSTGMSNINEISQAIKILTSEKIKKKEIALLQCNTDYPTDYSDVNLNVIKTLREKYKLRVGFSDHTDSFIIPSLAVCKGAEIIEKHVTLSKKMSGPDHKASIEIKDFKKMIDLIKTTEKTFGSEIKQPTKSEKKNIKVARKSIVAKLNISKGENFNFKNLTTKRPGVGISPMLIKRLIGKKSKNNYQKNQLLKKTEVKK